MTAFVTPHLAALNGLFVFSVTVSLASWLMQTYRDIVSFVFVPLHGSSFGGAEANNNVVCTCAFQDKDL